MSRALDSVVERPDSPNTPLSQQSTTVNGIRYIGLTETNISSTKSRPYRDQYKAENRTEQPIIDDIIQVACSTKSKYKHEQDPLPWKKITPDWVEKHVDFDSTITVDEMLKRREVLKK